MDEQDNKTIYHFIDLISKAYYNTKYLTDIRIFLQNNSNILNKKYHDLTPLMYVYRGYHNLHRSYLNKILVKLFYIFLEYKPNLELTYDSERTVLTDIILFYNNIKCNTLVKLLIDHGADINHLDKYNKNILMKIISSEDNAYTDNPDAYILVKYLLENTQIDLYVQDKDNMTAYDYAKYYKCYKIAELIKEYMEDSLDTKCALD